MTRWASDVEEVSDGVVVVDVQDGLSKERGDADGIHHVPAEGLGHGDGVRGEETLDGAGGQAGAGLLVEDGVGDAGEDAGGTVLLEDSGSGAEGAAGLRHVVHHQDVLTLHITDDGVGIHLCSGDTLLGHDGELGAEDVGVALGVLDAADVRRDDHEVVEVLNVVLLEVLDEDGNGVEVIHGDLEESLDLGGVQIHAEDAIDAGGSKEIGNELGGDGHSGLILAILAGIAVEGHDGGDAAGTGAAHRIHHDQQLHEVVVGGWAGGLNDESVRPTDTFLDLNEALTVRESIHGGIAEGEPQGRCNVPGQLWMCGAADDFHGKN